jgi:hypothetical protein
VIASHQFSDVPDTNIYHADIDALADAGVTTGCGDGSTFCPSAFVTREQMAAFMNRLGALAAGKTPVVNADKLDGLDSTGFVLNETVVGHFTCSGNALVPNVPGGWARSAVFGSFATTTTDVTFRCDVVVPDGSTVIGVTFEVTDSNAVELVNCSLIGYEANDGGISQFTMGLASTSLANVAGVQTLSDETINFAVIDNAIYHYFADCRTTGTTDATQVHGVRVAYEISGLPVT